MPLEPLSLSQRHAQNIPSFSKLALGNRISAQRLHSLGQQLPSERDHFAQKLFYPNKGIGFATFAVKEPTAFLGQSLG